MNRPLLGTVSLLLTLASVPCSSALAQTPAESPTTSAPTSPATMLPGGQLAELLSIYVPRSESDLGRYLEDARDLQRASASEIDDTRRRAAEADGRAKIMKEEMKTSKVRRDVAGKAKDQAQRTQLDAAFKQQTNEQAYLLRQRDALRADAVRLEAERQAWDLRVKALELELDAARKHAEVVAQPSDANKVAEYRSLLRNLLEAQKQAANRWIEASADRKRVAERKLAQLQSLSRL
ncbi:MAG: hypothetical protein IT347_06685 [Candidatus Eisenbacteria bacterium]|nr:hypothetical protein [Candidatus Eisenbacteria bacterium]